MRQFWGMFAGEVEFSAATSALRFKLEAVCRRADRVWRAADGQKFPATGISHSGGTGPAVRHAVRPTVGQHTGGDSRGREPAAFSAFRHSRPCSRYHAHNRSPEALPFGRMVSLRWPHSEVRHVEQPASPSVRLAAGEQSWSGLVLCISRGLMPAACQASPSATMALCQQFWKKGCQNGSWLGWFTWCQYGTFPEGVT